MTAFPADTLIQALQSPQAYPHAVDEVRLLETHISWVLLTGEFAYKLKKPVSLGFVDFSTLDRRRFFCDEEIRLNRRLAPDLYLDVVSITGTAEAPRIAGNGEPIESAVRMRQFPQEALLSRAIAENRLTAAHIDALAAEIAAFHTAIEAATADQLYGEPDRVHHPVAENFRHVAPLVETESTRIRLAALEEWAEREFEQRRETFATRKAAGCVRECHGDMHLGNMLLEGDRVLVFDGIEFNADLRWIDVLSEVAFTVMDLEDRGRPDFSRRLLNAYLEHTGDYAGLAVLPYYLCYRAMVRAKVAAIRFGQPGLDAAEQARCREKFESYLALAEHYARARPPMLVITHGYSGSGKTYGTQPLVEQRGFVRLRSDIERKRLAGVKAHERADASIASGLYTPEITARTYARLAELATSLLRAGKSVIVDATFLKRSDRERFRALAARENVPFRLLSFEAPEPTLRARIESRRHENRDASDATLAVLEHQQQTADPLAPDELPATIPVTTGHPNFSTELVRHIAAIEPRPPK